MPEPNAILRMARAEAQRNAIDLLAYSSAVYPDEIHDLVSAKILEIGVAFAVNARRCFEVASEPAEIVARRWKYQMNGSQKIEKDLWRALNGIIHARNLSIHFAESPQAVFSDSRNSVALHFVYETDRYPETYVDLFGLAWTFLSFGPFAWEESCD
ncbi:hypothetical protein [Saliniramus fredricksonii]|nr:hypothetical protein [Saliniramus fredricksonii]